MPFASMLARARRPVAAALIAAFATGPALAAPPALPSNFQPVTIDGSASAWTTVAGQGQAFNVIFDGATFHLWYRADENLNIGGLRYATSANGINFTTVGGPFSFAADPFTPGTPPALYYEAVSRVGAEYKLIHWTYTGGAGTFPAYDYNSSVSNIGVTISNTAVAHQGAIAGGTGGQTAGTFGIEAGSWFGQCDLGRDVCASPYSDLVPPNVAGSIYPPVLDADPLFGTLGIPTGYINNHGDVRLGGIGLDMAFTVRDGAGNRFNQQVYFSESSDNGATWTAPVGLVAGAPSLVGGFGVNPNFAHPELVRTPTGALLYVSTQAASGDFIIAVADARLAAAGPAAPVPALGAGGLVALLALLAAVAAPTLRRRGATAR
jgi:hypothetical protein